MNCKFKRSGATLSCPVCGFWVQTNAAKVVRPCSGRREESVPVTLPPEPEAPSCIHRSEPTDSAACQPCRNRGRRRATIYECPHFGRVTDGQVVESGKTLHNCGVACEQYNDGNVRSSELNS